jgi:hypothetical protein
VHDPQTGGKKTANSTTYVQATLFASDGSGDVFIIFGYYEDILAKSAEGWRIEERHLAVTGATAQKNASATLF